jgi:hypothetical protein
LYSVSSSSLTFLYLLNTQTRGQLYDRKRLEAKVVSTTTIANHKTVFNMSVKQQIVKIYAYMQLASFLSQITQPLFFFFPPPPPILLPITGGFSTPIPHW